MFGPFGGFFPGFGGILPSYYPYLAAMGFGRCCCPNPLQNLPPFVLFGTIPQQGISPLFLRQIF